MTDTVPVFRPQLMAQPQRLLETLGSGWWGTGPRVTEFEAAFGEHVGASPVRCLMLNSCTAALHLAVRLFPGRRFLVPAMTFISTALAPLYEQRRIEFVDVREDDLCIDEADALHKVRGESDVVIAVHMGGHVARLKQLRRVCHVIEDCAHALGSYDEDGAHVGTASVGCFSFQATKGLTIGDGGMLVLTADEHRAKAEAEAWCGIESSTWRRSNNDYRWAYDIHGIGYKYRANDVSAALALDQWPGLPGAVAERCEIAASYRSAFGDLDWLILPEVRDGTKPNWQEYVVRTEYRDGLQEHLAKLGVATTVHYYPLNLYDWLHYQHLQTAEKMLYQILTIPCFAGMTEKERERVVDDVRSFRP